jgi:Peptidase A4 family
VGEPVEPSMTLDAAMGYLDQVTTYDPPLPDFDPFQADARELAVYGYPRRPDPETEPHLSPLWEKAFRFSHRLIRARPEINRGLLEWRQDGFGVSGWGGVIVEPASYGFPEPANVVYGEWSVPALIGDPAHPSSPLGAAFWIGLNGYIVSQQVLQAGIAAKVTGSTVGYQAWFEWYPGPPVAITNFPITVGDRLSVLVCAPRDDHGFVSIQNKTEGVITNCGFPAPLGIHSDGTSAEWVVEMMKEGLDELPDFGAIVFLNATAGTRSHRLDLSKATMTEIGGTGGRLLTNSTVWGPGGAMVVWQSFG